MPGSFLKNSTVYSNVLYCICVNHDYRTHSKKNIANYGSLENVALWHWPSGPGRLVPAFTSIMTAGRCSMVRAREKGQVGDIYF